MGKPAKAEKPTAEMSEAERIAEWRQKRLQRGEITKPKGKGKSDGKDK